MHPLNRSTRPASSLIGASAPATPGMIHLGIGNFHRAHAAVYTALAMEESGGVWGISAYAHRSRGVIDAMGAQDGLYSVLQLSPSGEQAQVVDVHRRFGVLTEDPAAVVAEIADSSRRVLTVTVSEGGYGWSPNASGLDLENAGIRADLAAGSAPRTVIGAIARGVERRAASGEPMTIQSCDNLQGNGDVARAVLTQFLEESGADEDVLRFARTRVGFPNSMVDRIVPATTDRTRESVERLLGVRDGVPVPTEEFTMWVMQDDHPGGRPDWEAAGAVISDQVDRYELVKLRLVNASQSLLAYLGVLQGIPTIPGAWQHPAVQDAVLAQIRHDALPTIPLPDGLDPEAYIDSLVRRWENVPLADSTSRIASLGSIRLPQRIPAAALHQLHAGRMPHVFALLIASWIATNVRPEGITVTPEIEAVDEPARERMLQAVGAVTTPREIARAILEAGFLGLELPGQEDFTDRVGELLEVLCRGGVEAAIRDAIG
ncbi:fructuronate reductase [Brachybacterium endophyticum]|uniref:Mannitol-1-phosphate 5-dehydrogenase n=1 Tax=Brachybacterium endophyticum TaxID=2182385 RepID=A0A2U2RMZ2_9MICO|nr:mannitol dehydrogenase family protein [Brachybacterium endophyticum]PWH07238.1 fructuronate reductase [Brachybacterium endophyticum]